MLNHSATLAGPRCFKKLNVVRIVPCCCAALLNSSDVMAEVLCVLLVGAPHSGSCPVLTASLQQTPSHLQAWFAKGSSGSTQGRKGEKRKPWEVLVPSSKEAERGLVQVVFQLEESPRTRVWMKPGFFLPKKKEYTMEMEVNVNKSGQW